MSEYINKTKKKANTHSNKKITALQMKSYSNNLSDDKKISNVEIDNLIQQKSTYSNTTDSETMDFLIHRKSEWNTNNTGIPSVMKDEFEQKSGFSFDDVRVHYNSDKPSKLQALAYTQGNQVYVAPGQEKHLGHELGHVVQQKQGIVKPNASINGLPLNNDKSLENQADMVQTKSIFTNDKSNTMNYSIVQQRPVYDAIQLWSLKEWFKSFRSPIYRIAYYLDDGSEEKVIINKIIEINLNIAQINAKIQQLLDNGFSEKSIAGIIYGASHSENAFKIIDTLREDMTDNAGKQHFADVFLSCFSQMADYCINVKHEFPDYDVKSTGSDPHSGGSQALFLDKDGEHKKVYKGHSLTGDDAFVGKEGMLAYFNTLFSREELEKYNMIGDLQPFVTMDIDTESSTEEFIKREIKQNETDEGEALSIEQAKRYYFQMGMLECASLAIGGTDLHQDNIMPTSAGPLVIDAECVFIHTGSTCISNALNNSSVGNKVACAKFIINDSGADLVSTDAFDKNPIYKKCFNKGFNVMLNKLQLNVKKAAFRNKIRKIVDKVTTVRIVPIATLDFTGDLKTYNYQYNNILIQNQVIDYDRGRIKKFIEEHFTNPVFNVEVANAQLRNAFNSGTIPALTVDIHNGEILLDNVKICDVTLSVDTIVDKILNTIRSIEPMHK